MTKQGELKQKGELASGVLDAALSPICPVVTVVECVVLADPGLCLLGSKGPWEG